MGWLAKLAPGQEWLKRAKKASCYHVIPKMCNHILISKLLYIYRLVDACNPFTRGIYTVYSFQPTAALLTISNAKNVKCYNFKKLKT